MTREQILEMPAGRELDALVAERVMGWHRQHDCGSPEMWADGDGRWMYRVAWREGDPDSSWALWMPSTDIDDAWQVFHHCRRQLFSKRTRFFRVLGELLQRQPGLEPGLVVAWPEAMMFLTERVICHAALLARLEAP